MTTNEKILNEKICKWMGYHKHKLAKGLWINMELKPQYFKPDFLHDRNQQKWIIDELVKRGYRIEVYFSEYGSDAHIWHNDRHSDFSTTSDNIDDTAFIQAVEQLIDKEEK